MNSKKANWAFLITLFCYIGLIYVAAFLFPALMDNLFFSNFFVELTVIIPILVFALISGEKLDSFLGFHKIKISTVLKTVLFTFLTVPTLTLFNLISQLWVENEVAVMLEEQQAGQMSFGVLFLSVGIVAPVFEEIACRGAYYRSFCKSGSAFKAMLMSAAVFALVHMNFNQAAYAFVMGILAVLLVEATGSLWASVLYHGLINGSNALLMYGALKADPGIYSGQAVEVTNDFMIYGIAVYLVFAAVTLPLAWAVLVWIGTKEGRSDILTGIWKGRKEKKDKMVTVPFVLGLILCLSVMTGIFAHLMSQLIFR